MQDALAEITALLRKHRLVEGLVHEQLEHAPVAEDGERGEVVESLVTKQNKAQLQRRLDRLHPADIAFILEALPLDERLYIWDLVKAERDGEILLEVSEPVRESLISSMDTEELVAATETLDAEEIAELAPDLPQEVMDDVFSSLPVEEREQLRAAMSFEDDMVGALMDFEDLQVRPDVTLEVVLRYLRRFDELPSQTDQLFVVDRDEKLLGVLPVNKLIVSEPETLVSDVMLPPVVKLAAAREGDGCGVRVRALRPRVRAGGRHQRQARRPRDGRRDPRLRARARRGGNARAGRPARGGGRLRVGVEVVPEPLDVARDQPRHRVHRVARDRRLRGLDREAGRARRADADRRGHRRQFRQPDDHDDRARGGAGPGHARACAQAHPQGDHRRADQRPRLGRRDGARRDAALQGCGARARHDARDDAQPHARGVDGRADPDDACSSSGAIPRVGSSVLITAVTDSGGFFIFLGPRHAVPGPVGLKPGSTAAAGRNILDRACWPRVGSQPTKEIAMLRKTLPLCSAALLAVAIAAGAQTMPAKKAADGTWTDAKGMTLYTFDKDAGGKSACNGPCATNWPPLMAAGDAKASGDWTIVTRDDGGKQWAYKGKPLYTWTKDTKPGDKTGDNVNNVWHTAKD